MNTIDREEDREQLVDPDALRAWLIEVDLADAELRAGPADLRRAIAVREALRGILLAHNGASSAARDAGDA